MENSYFIIISSEFPKKKNVYLDHEEYTEETALLKKRVSKSKHWTEDKWPEERQDYKIPDKVNRVKAKISVYILPALENKQPCKKIKNNT